MPSLLLLLLTVWSAIAGHGSAEPRPPDEPRVYVGIHLDDLSGFDLKDGRFRADLQLWCKWLADSSGGTVDVPPITLGNAEVDEMTLVARESDGDWHSARWRVQGTFRGTFPLHDFPRDKQYLTIEVDLPEEQGTLVPDLAGSGMVDTFSITGWLYERYFEAHTGARVFHTDFGSITHEGRARRVHTVSFVLTLARPLAPYVVKFLLPLYVILGACALIFAVRLKELEVRAGLATSCLLSCVAFHFTQADSLPAVPYMVTADQLFLGSYFLVLFALATTVVGHRIHRRRPDLAFKVDASGAAVFITLALALGVYCFATPPHNGPQLDLVAHAEPLDTRPVAESPEDTLRVSVGAINGLSVLGIDKGLLRRGLVHTVEDGRRVPFLVAEVPDFTNHLVRFDADGGMTVRWRLRPGLKWGDGQPITADDLLFSATLSDDPERGAVTRVDHLTIDVHHLKRRFDGLQPFSVLPAHTLAAIAEEGGADAVWDHLNHSPPPLDGPYVLESFEKGRQAVFVRNPHFAGHRPAIERLIIRRNKRPLPEVAATGDVDLSPLVSDRSLKRIAELGTYIERRDPSAFQYFLQPDLTQAPLDDLQVRKAVAHAIDRQAVATTMFGTPGIAADSYLPPHDPAHAKGLLRYDGGAAEARRILTRAGYTLPVPLRVRAMRRVAGSNEEAAIEAVAEHLRAGGFDVTLDLVDGSVFRDYLSGTHGSLLVYNKRTFELGSFWNVPYIDNAWHLEAPARVYDNDALELVQAWSHTLYDERRQVIAKRLQHRHAELLPTIPLTFGPVGSLHAPGLTGWDPVAGADTVWWNAETWRLEPR